MPRRAAKSTEISRRDPRTPTTGVRCPLGTVANLSPSGLRAETTTRPSVLTGHTLRIHIEAGNRKIDVKGKIVWVKRAGRFKKEWHLGVKFEDQSDAIRDAILTIANAFSAERDEHDDSAGQSPATAAADVDDLYAILGLTPACSTVEIREAFRKLAFQWHPDRCKLPEAPEIFDRINKAHSILKDPATRRRYDDMLTSGGRRVA